MTISLNNHISQINNYDCPVLNRIYLKILPSDKEILAVNFPVMETYYTPLNPLSRGDLLLAITGKFTARRNLSIRSCMK